MSARCGRSSSSSVVGRTPFVLYRRCRALPGLALCRSAFVSSSYRASGFGTTRSRTASCGGPYEEFHPYGTSAYRSARSGVEVSERRFRYTGKERDEETGFQIHGLRYYCPWLGRWTTADPAGLADGVNMYGYARGDPVGKVDPSGTTSISDIHQRVQSRVYEAQRAAPVDLGPSAGQPRDGPDRDGQIGPGGGRVPGPQKLEAAHPANRVDPQRMRTEADARNVPLPIREMQEVIGPAVDPIGAGSLRAGTYGVAEALGATPEEAMQIAQGVEGTFGAAAMVFGSGPGAGPDVATGLRRPTGEPSLTGATGRALRGSGQQVVPERLSGPYIPIENGRPVPLAQQRLNNVDIPLPDPAASGPHTVLGGKTSTGTGETYRQSATFPAEGTWPSAAGQPVPWSRVDWTTHGRPKDHANPHQHEFQYNFQQKRWTDGPPRPFRGH